MIPSSEHHISFELKAYLKIAKTIGIIPRGNAEDTLSKMLLKNFHFPILFGVFIYCYTISIVGAGIDNLSGESQAMVTWVLSIIEKVMGSFYMTMGFLNAFRYHKTWKTLSSMRALEKQIHDHDANNNAGIFRLIFTHAVLVFVRFFAAQTVFKFGVFDLQYFYQAISALFLIYWQLISVHLFWEMTSSLKVRYDNLNAVMSSMNLKMETAHIKSKIRQIKTVYIGLRDEVVNINDVFETTVFMLLGMTVIRMLNSCSWYLEAASLNLDFAGVSTIVTLVLNPLYSLTLTILLIIAFDRVEECGTGIVRTCYCLQEDVEKSEICEELMYLLGYLERLAPTFTAYGLLSLNRRILSSLMSFTILYVITVVQLATGDD